MAGGLPDKVRLRKIEPGDKVSGFDLEPEHLPLKTFLKKDARKFHASNVVLTYILVDDENPNPGAQVWGYLSLMCSEINIKDGGVAIADCPRAERYSTLSAIKIARLAIDRRLERRGLGTQLVDFAISVTQKKIMPEVGCRFLILDSKENSKGFYTKSGFTLLDTEKNAEAKHKVMFIDMHKLTNGNAA